MTRWRNAARLVLVAGLFTLAALPAPAQQVRVTGLFSDMHYIPQAGDVLGTEVFIVVSPGGYSAVVQLAEGQPQMPVVVPVNVNGLDVSFSLPNNLKFAGRVSNSALVGTLGFDKVSLRRGKSYWQ